jgi:hypothetical protein
MCDFPFRPANWEEGKTFTREDYNKIPFDERFNMCFPGINKEGGADTVHELTDMPYTVNLEDISSYYDNCSYCDERKCEGCRCKYTEDFKVKDLLNQIKLEHNDTFFSTNKSDVGKELKLNVVFHPGICPHFTSVLMSAVTWDRKDIDPETAKIKETDNVQMEDCLREFKVTETLDEDNKWYCNKCKDHVVATKTMEVFRVPPILCISLKRFRIGRSKYGFSSSGTKIDTMVDFPLEGLDMRDYVLCGEQR